MNVIEKKNTWIDGVVGEEKQEFIKEMYQYHQSLFDYSHMIANTDIAKIEISKDKVIMKFKSNGLSFICREGDERSMPMDTLNFGQYEKKETDTMLNLLSQINSIGNKINILDIGANIGYTTCLLASNFENAMVYAFEPIKQTYEDLLNNIKLNNLKNIKAYNIGLSNENKDIEFYYYPNCIANTSISNLRHTENYIKVSGKLMCLDDVEELKKETIDFIKCDVEGNELYVIKGAKKLISYNQPIIFIEILRKYAKEFNYAANDVCRELYALGYNSYIVSEDRKLIKISEITEQEKNVNFVFLHADKHKSLLDENVRL